jgi:hypothetical protein
VVKPEHPSFDCHGVAHFPLVALWSACAFMIMKQAIDLKGFFRACGMGLQVGVFGWHQGRDPLRSFCDLVFHGGSLGVAESSVDSIYRGMVAKPKRRGGLGWCR